MKYVFLIGAFLWFGIAVSYLFANYEPGKITTTIAFIMAGFYFLIQFDKEKLHLNK